MVLLGRQVAGRSPDERSGQKMSHRSRATLIAGAFCALVIAAARVALADPTADALAHVNASIAAPAATPAPRDACAGRGWTLATPLRFCGRIRLVPADPRERDLWWGEHLSELADAAFSAAGERALFTNRQVVVSGMMPAALGRRGEAFAFRGQAWNIANLEGYSSPARAEANPFVRPFAAGGVGGYLLGFFSIDLGQNLIGSMAPAFGLRGLDELSRRSILVQDIGEHVAGAQSWVPVLHVAQDANAAAESCTDLALRSLTYGPGGTISIGAPPKRCATIWPTIK